jgi:hypothetical protein
MRIGPRDFVTDFSRTKVRGSAALAWKEAFAPLAQLAEQVTLNRTYHRAKRGRATNPIMTAHGVGLVPKTTRTS